MSGYDDSQVMLSDDLDRKMVFKYRDVRVPFYRLYKAGLYLCSRIVLMVQDTELGMAAFAVQVEFAVLVLVEMHAPVDQLSDLFRSLTYHLFYGLPVADPVAGYHRIFDVFFKIIYGKIGYRGNAALRKIGICLFEAGFANKSDFPFMRHFQGKAHSCNARSDH